MKFKFMIEFSDNSYLQTSQFMSNMIFIYLYALVNVSITLNMIFIQFHGDADEVSKGVNFNK